MKRLFMAVIMAAVTVSFTGCGEETKTTTTKKVETPSGSTEVKKEESTTKKGDAPPAKP